MTDPTAARDARPVLHRGGDGSAVADRLTESCGGRAGLDGVLGDLNRAAEPGYAPGSAVSWAFTWDREDTRSRRWWPQGITSSSEARLPGTTAPPGPPLLVTTSYAKKVAGLDKGCRITVADLTDPRRVRYRHVLLVRPVLDEHGRVDLRPVRAHAGGVVWHGPWLYVAATRVGVLAFRLDDIVRVLARPDDRLGRTAEGMAGFGHGYALPLAWTYRQPADSAANLRYSFLSLARDPADTGAWLLAGEYDAGSGSRRLVRFPLDPTGGLAVDGSGTATAEVLATGVERMQGAVWLPGPGAGDPGRLVVTASNGRYRRGHLWTGAPGDLRRRTAALPVGPEDLTWWPEREEFWTLTEYPGLRVVAALRA